MPNLIFIRHSETKQQADVNSHEWQLTDRGRERCHILAEALRDYHIDRMITSEEAKANLTGKLVADVLDIPCETAPDLHETKRKTVPYFDSLDDFKAAVKAAMLAPDELLFGEESFTAARERFSKQVDNLIAEYSDGTLAIVTHGTVLALYLAQFSEQDVVTIWNSLDMPAYAVLELSQKMVIKIVNSITQGE